MFPSDPSFKDYFETLEISPFASHDVLKAAYKALAKIYHPDSLKNEKLPSKKTMAEINEAYEILSNPSKRREYWDSYCEIVGKKANAKTWYFYKQWENYLKENQRIQVKKEKPKEEDTSKLYVQKLLSEFFILRGERKYLFLEQTLSLSSHKEEFLRELLRSPHLKTQEEKEAFAFLLKNQIVISSTVFF